MWAGTMQAGPEAASSGALPAMNLTPLQSLPLVTVPAGQVVIEQSRPFGGIYFLESGEVEVLKNGIVVAEIFERGAVFGEMSWLLETVPTATVRTTTVCTFRHATEAGAFLRQHPDVTLHMAAILARRVDSLTRYLVDIKNQFKDRSDHLGIIDEVLDSLIHKHPRNIPRRDTGD
jgi:CRP/FNR family cyclic AMP-dependent transcriptional regulator